MAKVDLKSVLGGLLLVAAYSSLFKAVGFRAEQNQPFFFVSWRESYFWIAHFGLAVPGFGLIFSGVSDLLDSPLLRAADSLISWRRKTWFALGAFFALMLFALSALGRKLLLLGIPITADEHGVLFGGRMVAAGFLRVPIPEPQAALPLYYAYFRDGFVSSFDFPGGIFFSALSLVSGTGALAYSAITALSGLAIAWAGGLLAGRQGSLAAAAIWLFSPMALSLSYTTHAQLLSRSFVAGAVALYCYLVCDLRRRDPNSLSSRQWVCAGLWLGGLSGLAFLCRPIEAACMMAPPAFHLSWIVWRERNMLRAWLSAAAAWLSCALTFAWYNAQITGSWWVQARFSPQFGNKYNTDQTAADLLGTNAGFNLLMLGIFFLGPIGLGLVWSAKRSPLVITLFSGIALQLAVALLHPDTGIHLVGPIHYSECAVPLTLLAVLGLVRLWNQQTAVKIPKARLAVLSAAYLASLGLFNAVHSLTLRDQAEIQKAPFDALAKAGIENAVVIAEPPHQLWALRPEMAEIRSWVATWPLPDPFMRDEILFVHPYVEPAEISGFFPDRALYRMTFHEQGEPVRLHPLVP